VLKATNLDVGIALTIPARAEQPGAGTVPARVFVDFIAALNGETVEMEWNESTATMSVRCGSFRSRIKGIPAAEFPAWSARDEKETVITFSAASTLAAALNQVSIAVAKEESRPVLTGVCAVIAPDGVTFAAADGFRLAVKRVPATIQPALAEPRRIILPAAAVKLLPTICGDSGTVELRVNAEASRVAFLVPAAEIVARLIEGNYPQFEQIIPSAATSRVIAARDDLRGALKAGKPFAAKNRVDLAANAETNIAMVSASAPEGGDSSSELSVTLEGPSFQIALSDVYLSDFLGGLATPQVALEFTGPARPVVLRGVGDGDFVGVIMPMGEPNPPASAPVPASVTVPATAVSVPQPQPQPA
jgi:DNA polymerase-3 subunit beta